MGSTKVGLCRLLVLAALAALSLLARCAHAASAPVKFGELEMEQLQQTGQSLVAKYLAGEEQEPGHRTLPGDYCVNQTNRCANNRKCFQCLKILKFPNGLPTEPTCKGLLKAAQKAVKKNMGRRSKKCDVMKQGPLRNLMECVIDMRFISTPCNSF